MTTQQRFELDTKIVGKNSMTYMADLIKKVEKQEIEIESTKQVVGVLKQMNNRSRLLLDAAKFELKEAEAAKEAK